MSKKDVEPKIIKPNEAYIPVTFIKICYNGICFIEEPEKAFKFILDKKNSIDNKIALSYKFYLISLTWKQFENLPDFEGF